MVTYNVNSDSFGVSTPDAPDVQPAAADRRGGSITILADGTSKLSMSRGAVSVDSSEGIERDKEASKSGPLNTPISFFKKSGRGGSVADAEADPKAFKFVQGGTKVSLQTALNSGLVKKVGDHYYDYRANPDFGEGDTQTQSQEDAAQDQPEDTQEIAPDVLAESGFEMSEEGAKAVGKLQEVMGDNPDLVDDAITKLVSSDGEAVNTSSFIEQIANETGMTKDETAEVVGSSITEYRAAASRVIETQVPGLDGQAFLDHIRETSPQVADRMVYAQMAGDFSPHIAAANDYITQLPKYDREAALSADLGANAKVVEINGQVMVDFNGKRLTWADAMRFR